MRGGGEGGALGGLNAVEGGRDYVAEVDSVKYGCFFKSGIICCSG